MATPDQGRRRTWRFKLNDRTTLEVSAAEGQTEKQVRRRGRWSLILGTLVAATVLVTVASAADDGSVDGDVGAPGNQNSVSITTNAGATVNTAAGLVIERAGNQAHLAVGNVVVVEYDSAASNLPAGATVSDVTLTVPSPWTVNGEKVSGTSNIAFTAPATSTTYTVKWQVKSGPTCVNASGNADCFNMSGAFTINLTISAPPSNTPPSISVTGVAHGATYEIGSVPAAGCSVTDTEDGPSTFPATLSAISGPLSGYGLGSQVASCSYIDAGGLSANDSATYSIVDTTDPLITFVSRTPAANGNGWNNTNVTVNWSCADSGSGVLSATKAETVSTEGPNQSATGTCTDHAGNTATDTQTGINID